MFPFAMREKRPGVEGLRKLIDPYNSAEPNMPQLGEMLFTSIGIVSGETGNAARFVQESPRPPKIQ
jgi:hypothetical protein